MSDWTAGYTAEIEYTRGYYSQMNPQHIQLLLLAAGVACPAIENACELGFGQGLSANMHAAASVTHWYGTDFNPSQACQAQNLATQCGNNAQLYDEAFEAFCQRPELPMFDYIALHGIWSWISDENRQHITDFIARRLKPGGVLYISYNTQPGWASMVPMRELLLEHSETVSAPGEPVAARVSKAMDFAQQLLETNPAFLQANPRIAERISSMADKDPAYLAHEYFNRDWLPMSFSRMSEWLSPAKMTFAASAEARDHVDIVDLTESQQQLLSGITDVAFYQSTRDFMTNQQFRRDIWVKGAVSLSPLQQLEQWYATRVMLLCAVDSVELTFTGTRGELQLSAEVYQPLLELLSDGKAHTVQELEQQLQPQGVNLSQLKQAILLLVSKGALTVVQPAATSRQVLKACQLLNQQLKMNSRDAIDVNFLVSPVTGGGIQVDRFTQLFLLAQDKGYKQPEQWADFVWQHLKMLGQKVKTKDRVLETEEENLVELSRLAHEFAEKRLTLLKTLKIIP